MMSHEIIARVGGTLTLKVVNYCDPSNPHTLEVPEFGYRRWLNGALIQDALPQLTPEQREILISGIGPKDWDAMFSKEDR